MPKSGSSNGCTDDLIGQIEQTGTSGFEGKRLLTLTILTVSVDPTVARFSKGTECMYLVSIPKPSVTLAVYTTLLAFY